MGVAIERRMLVGLACNWVRRWLERTENGRWAKKDNNVRTLSSPTKEIAAKPSALLLYSSIASSQVGARSPYSRSSSPQRSGSGKESQLKNGCAR